MSTLLNVAAIMALATDPACGAAPANSELATRLTAIALRESGNGRTAADPFIIGVNPEPSRGLGPMQVRSTSAEEAVEKALKLLSANRRIDVGLMQISFPNLSRHWPGVPVEQALLQAFQPCASMRAGSNHFQENLQRAWAIAHNLYNCGGPNCAQAYANGMEGTAAAIRGAPPAVGVIRRETPQRPSIYAADSTVSWPMED